MDIDTATTPVGDVTSPATQEVTDPNTEVTAPAGGTTEGTTTYTDTDGNDGIADLLPPVVEEVEVDYEGAKYKVPAPLKEALLRQQDYTVKTQTLAEERRQVETARQQFHEAQQLNTAEIRAFSRLENLNAQLAEFEGINWGELDHSDPQVQHAKGVRDELHREQSALTAQINGHLTAKQARAQHEAAKEREGVDKAMAAKIKDWGPEKRSQFEAFAVSKGIPAEFAGQAGAAEFDIIRLAMIGAQTEKQRMAALSAAAAAKTQPAQELGQGSGSGTSDPSGMTMEQYAAWRAKQKD